MRRQEFITLLGGAAVAWPLLARTQQPALPCIGLLLAIHGPVQNGIVRSLAERGYVDGKTARIEQRIAEGQLERS